MNVSLSSILIIVISMLFISISSVSAVEIKLQPIQVCNDSFLFKSCADTSNLFEAETNKIWAQAGHTITYLPTKIFESDKYFNIKLQSEFDSLIDDPNAKRTDGAYDMWIVDSIKGEGLFGSSFYGYGLLSGDGFVISDNIFAENRIDTIAHELAHNLGLDHVDSSITDSTKFLLAEGESASGKKREIPSGLGDISPDGNQLARLDLIQPPIASVDTIGSTPNVSDDFFKVNFDSSGSATNLFLTNLSIDLSPVDAFVDSTNAPPGLLSSPLRYSNFNGINLSDITATGFNNGSQLMNLAFSPSTFGVGDSFNFGVDIDLFSNIDAFGATPSELNGAIVTYDFSNGVSIVGALDGFISTSNFDPNAYVDKVPDIRFRIYSEPDPILTSQVPEPNILILMLVGLNAFVFRFSTSSMNK